MQWILDYSNPRFFETPDSLNQSCFPWISFRQIFIPTNFELPFFEQNSVSLVKGSKNWFSVVSRMVLRESQRAISVTILTTEFGKRRNFKRSHSRSTVLQAKSDQVPCEQSFQTLLTNPGSTSLLQFLRKRSEPLNPRRQYN